MSSTLRFPLEAFKFSLYLTIPVVCTVLYADPDNMAKIVNYTRFIVYPAAGERPPLGEEIEKTEIFKKLAAEKKLRELAQPKKVEAKKGWWPCRGEVSQSTGGRRRT